MSRTATIWNNENEQFLIENFSFITNRRLSEQLDISISSIKKKAHELGLNKGCVKRKIIPSLEKDVLKMTRTNSYRFVAEMLSISLSSVSVIRLYISDFSINSLHSSISLSKCRLNSSIKSIPVPS